MERYTIRLLNKEMKPVSEFDRECNDDGNAVIFARKCAAGRAVEVWHNSICIFRTPPSRDSSYAAHSA